MAVALDQRLVMVQPAASGDGARKIGGDAVEFAAVLERPEAISSLAWLAGPEQTGQALLFLVRGLAGTQQQITRQCRGLQAEEGKAS